MGEAPAASEGALPAIGTAEAPLDAAQRQAVLLQAEAALQESRPDDALQTLAQPGFQRLPLDQETQLRIGQIRAGAYGQQERHLAAARELAAITGLLPSGERQAHHDLLLGQLLQLDPALLQSQAERSPTLDMRGWLALAAALKEGQGSPAKQLASWKDWLKVWPDHPAAIHRPTAMQMLPAAARNLPTHLALILPLSGELASIGTAIRDGFILAHFQQSPEVRLTFHDSSEGDIRDLVKSAWDQGADLVIGPLDRERVTRVARMSLKSPVIALNRTRDGSSNPRLYQFGLAPEDESIQVAERIVKDGGARGLLIAPDGDWGLRNAKAFTKALRDLGGEIVESATFEQQGDYALLVKTLLKVDASEAREEVLRDRLNRPLEFTPRRRQDIDFVFLLANPTQAKGINPALAFYYAENLPRYATSHVHELSDSRIDLIDMNGIHFCDMPFKLPGQQDALKAEVRRIWPGAAGRLAPFFALGLDVHRLYPQLRQLKAMGGSLAGATGKLSLTRDNVVRRSLVWARIFDGEVERLAAGGESG